MGWKGLERPKPNSSSKQHFELKPLDSIVLEFAIHGFLKATIGWPSLDRGADPFPTPPLAASFVSLKELEDLETSFILK